MMPWQLTARPTLSLRDRLRLLVGVPLYVRFTSPDGRCHAACHLSVSVQDAWPEDDQALGGWPPIVPPIPIETIAQRIRDNRLAGRRL